MERPADIARKLPTKPGVYLYYNETGEVIYVGKAKNLRARVSSYFRPSADLSPAKKIMITEIVRLETIIVRTETEALLLESTMIKKYRPRYNIILKDDKYFQFIKINLRERFPSVSTVRHVTLDGSRYFGPYTSGFAVRGTMRLLKRLFPYKSCPNKPEIPCFDYQLGRCLGHDTGPGSEARYHEVIQQLIRFLSGDTGNVLKTIKSEMEAAAADHDFEAAAQYRDRLHGLQHVLEQQTVVVPSRQSFDVVSFARLGDLAGINLFQIRKGKLVQRDQFMLQHVATQTDADIVAAFCSQYYGLSTNHPPKVFVPVPISLDMENALQIEFAVAGRGLKKKLQSMGQENATEYVKKEKDKWLSEEAKARLALEELAHALNLEGAPHRIEMYDISHNQSTNVVGSMVVFEDGRPKKSDYRKFAIRNTKIPDDQHRLAEVLQRRFSHHGEDGWPIPDLIILDGGKGQLSVVAKNVPGLAQAVPLAALAKQHEELFVLDRSTPIRLPEGSQELFLIQRIRDEAHRFAIGFYRQKHRRETTKSILDEIPGLGDEGRRLLRKTYGTIEEIRKASSSDLQKLLGEKRAAAVEQYL